ncbi:2,3-diketo-5-methylthio-1-phosphopentane phosphatase [Aaosphaeria arxii CBS 175.79]|uniref:2,3-diketo-5-methylthio-1-phosphopentane phosphatase n=1 Tax=Aaosphaeria arxii CBS 175.79 TaxID=1450172 RepID=A0A6A5XUE0_9PLEO|nr:2,3-diketo-5-methylthio-1-phosphopentane phosphatase [Aaosphaeria arxii CBS 175.79]KAF2016536.1 2,3-diketo-5-methylthio-1-phosphopentane phosphatase [Aaosphaeria arxii CBS 175.79]
MSVASLDRERWERTETVVLDIEGTISSISFVKDVLYPYALDRLRTLARDSWSDPSFQDLIVGFPEETRTDAETLIAHVEDLTRNDIKAVYLKQLQGKLWKIGYSDGDLKTPLFDDVIPTLEAWKNAGKTLVIFSSGSVQAQLQFFSYVQDGSGSTRDLKPLFSAHFDTVSAGSKLEATSYEKICKEIGKPTAQVTFLTDNVKEAVAATEAGVHTIVVDRPGNAPLSPESKSQFAVIESLADLPRL